IAGSAVATMVWSTTARNIGSMIEKKMRKKLVRAGAGTAAAASAPPVPASPAGGAAGGLGSQGWQGMRRSFAGGEDGGFSPPPIIATMAGHRSEERRVGKECRSRGSPDH